MKILKYEVGPLPDGLREELEILEIEDIDAAHVVYDVEEDDGSIIQVSVVIPVTAPFDKENKEQVDCILMKSDRSIKRFIKERMMKNI